MLELTISHQSGSTKSGSEWQVEPLFMLASNGGGKQNQFQRQKNRIRPAILVRPESGTGAKVPVRR